MDVRERMQLAADEAERALSGDVAPAEPTPEVAGLPAENTDPEPQPSPEPEPQPEAPAAPTAPAAPANDAALQAEVARLRAQLDDENSPTFKARWQSLQGMYNADTARFRAELEELKTNPAKTAAPAVTPASDGIYNSLVEEVGQTTADILKPYLDKIAALEATVTGVAGDVKTTKEKTAQVEAVQAQTEGERFYSELNRIAPDWKTINGWEPDGIKQDPRLAGFVSQVIPGTSLTYQDALERHYEKRDVAKVAEIFNLFKKTTEVAKPAVKTPAADPSRYVEPDKTGKGVAVPAGAAEIIPHDEYNSFVNSVKKGTFSGTREERTRLEARYDKAFQENRIR